MLVKLWHIVIGHDVVTLQNTTINNSNPMLFPAPVFKYVFYCYMTFTSFVMTADDNLM